jgi:hypothetical protein
MGEERQPRSLNGAGQYATPVAAVVALIAALSSLGFDLSGSDVEALEDRMNELELQLVVLRYECDCVSDPGDD